MTDSEELLPPLYMEDSILSKASASTDFMVSMLLLSLRISVTAEWFASGDTTRSLSLTLSNTLLALANSKGSNSEISCTIYSDLKVIPNFYDGLSKRCSGVRARNYSFAGLTLAILWKGKLLMLPALASVILHAPSFSTSSILTTA